MSQVELILIAVGLSMDAFAVSITIGLAVQKTSLKKMLTVGAYFGGFQAGMPIIGYLVASFFADLIVSYDHWIAFALLCFLGGKMIAGGLKDDKTADKNKPVTYDSSLEPDEKKQGTQEASLKPTRMLPLALATSIDALAVGVSFAFLRVSILPAITLIGIVTLMISMAGVKIGNMFGTKFKTKAEIAGGIILILIGLKILLEHLLM